MDALDLPPTPPGLPADSWVNTILEARALLPRQLLELFAQSVDSAQADDLPYVVSDWAIFAGRLHSAEHQADQALLDEGRMDEVVGDSPLTVTPRGGAELGPLAPGDRMFVDGREVVWVDEQLHRGLLGPVAEDAPCPPFFCERGDRGEG
ncbi:hypothetical protein [Allokutzneria sp. NRRL B-24872]|uniref:hypothetical protein n=1 Tax=Allokutzneria sp. NRRL B-24872 TaxID=1137961 RepID=UPI001178B04B|nr:hypothetical protein [Allokutzneria sp. NRRL B-24872]